MTVYMYEDNDTMIISIYNINDNDAGADPCRKYERRGSWEHC